MNPVYSIDKSYHSSCGKLKALIIDSRTCLLDSLAHAIGKMEGVEVSTANSLFDSQTAYSKQGEVQSGFDNNHEASGATDEPISEKPGRAVDIPDLTTYDLVLYCVGGFSAEEVCDDIKHFAEDFKNCRVIAVTEQQDDQCIALVDAEVFAGVVPAAYSTLQLVSCMWLIKSGVRFLPVEYRQSAATVSGVAQSFIIGKLEDKLTPRQLEVLEYVSLGKSNKYIAAELSLCESTVKVHVHEVMKRLGATSRTHASYIVNTLYRSDSVANPEVNPNSSVMASPQRSNAALVTG